MRAKCLRGIAVKKTESSHGSIALRIIGLYVLLGVVWALFSDLLLTTLAGDVETLPRLRILIGCGYVAVTAVGLYALIRPGLTAVRTERVLAQEALRASEARYRDLFAGVPVGVFRTTPEGRFLEANPAMAQVLHCPDVETLLATKAADYYADPEDRTRWRALVESEGDVPQVELRWRCWDGEQIWVREGVRAVRDADGRVLYYEGIAQDITDQRSTDEALQHYAERLAVLREIDRAVLAEQSPETIAGAALHYLRQLVPCHRASVALFDYAEDEAVVLAVHAEGETRVGKGVSIPLGGFVGTPELREGQPLLVQDLEARGARSVVERQLLAEGIRSFLNAPLVSRGELVGTLNLGMDKAEAFSAEHVEVAREVADQLAIAVQNARLLQAEQQQRQRLALLADVARIAASTFEAESLLQAVAESISLHFGYPIIELFTLDDEGKTVILRGYAGPRAGDADAMTPGKYRQSIAMGIVGHVVRTGEPYAAADIRVDPFYYTAVPVDTRSELCVPALEDGRVVAVVNLESEELGDFDDEDRSLLEAVAAAVAIGLRNARLHEETQRRVRELMLLNRISIELGAGMDTDALIDRALDGLYELAKADHAFFVAVDSKARTWRVTQQRSAPDVGHISGLGGTFDETPHELEALLSGQPFAVTDVTTDPRTEALREMYQALDVRSILMVPVEARGWLYGAVGFDFCRKSHAWRPEETRLLRGVAHQLDLALDNARLFDEARVHAEELAAALAQQAELDRLKDQFVQNVSHELRSPLALIRGYAEMLDGGELGALHDEQRKPVSIIARRAAMLGELVEGITLILEARANPPQPELLLLDEIGQAAVEDFQVAARQAGVILRAEISAAVPVEGSPVYLRRVLDNLVGNAIKFTPAGGMVTVRVVREGTKAVLEVKDTGIGIPADEQKRVFERFYQVDGSVRRRYGGVGLGLALVKEIVEVSGGEVGVESEERTGSTFRVTLPISES